MKKRLTFLILALVLVTSQIVPAFAEETHEDIVRIRESGSVVYPVSGGNIYFNPESGMITKADRSITSADIPSSIEGVSVTSIGPFAFNACSKLTSITIPDGVTSIRHHAFSIAGVISVTLPDSLTSIERYAFHSCQKLKDITIPSGVTNIGEFAFDDCRSLPNVTIPDGVTRIENAAFAGCVSFTSVVIPDSVTSIGEYAFNNCENLLNVTIPDSVACIEDFAFRWCQNLKDVTLPKGLTKINDFTFDACLNLTNVTVPDSVVSVGRYAFGDCKITDVHFDGSRQQWEAMEIEEQNDTFKNATVHFGVSSPEPETISAPTISESEPVRTPVSIVPTPSISPAPKFTDVAAGSPFAAAIDWAVAQGITNGKTETAFGPSDTCTVSHILTFLWRANGKPGAEEGTADRDAAWKWAVENELATDASVANPTADPCTRAMAVTFMWKAAGSPEAKTDKAFTDMAAGAEYASAVAWAVENGVTAGTGDGTTFSPDNTCTRGQIVTFLYRAANAVSAEQSEAGK